VKDKTESSESADGWGDGGERMGPSLPEGVGNMCPSTGRMKKGFIAEDNLRTVVETHWEKRVNMNGKMGATQSKRVSPQFGKKIKQHIE